MALTAAGRRLLTHGKTADMFEDLIQRDPTAAGGLVPWDGRSPRDLTTARLCISLRHEGASLNEIDEQIEEQSRRHLLGW